MNIEALRNFHQSMSGFDPKELILVMFDELTNTITYFQNNYKQSKTFIASCINHMYFPRKFRFGVLTPEGFQKLMDNINTILTSGIAEDDTMMTSLGELEVSIYNTPKTIGQFNPGPQLFKKLEFVTFTNSLIVRILLRFYSPISRLLLKKIEYEKKHKDDKLIETFKQKDDKKLEIDKLNKR